MSVYMHNMDMQIYVRAYVHVTEHVCVHLYVYIYVHIYAYPYVYMYIHKYIHMYLLKTAEPPYGLRNTGAASKLPPTPSQHVGSRRSICALTPELGRLVFFVATVVLVI